MQSPSTLIFLLLAAGLAGFIDGAVGGGGLISIPALFLGLPAETTTSILGTNKVVACTGTTFAATQFVRSGIVPLREMIYPMAASGAGAVLGAKTAFFFEGRFEAHMRPLMLAMMAGMLLFTLLKPNLGTAHTPRYSIKYQTLFATALSFAIGFYDGFFGPGTGTLLIFSFVVVLGFDFLRASALSKTVNWASNIASLIFFLSRGSWLPTVAISMAVANGVGGYLGAKMALAKGSRWVRALFALVVAGLIFRLAWQMFVS
ncbi:MAG: TSUP family transporter [Holophagaceae bacterium]|nr:TSUP family transporter [Holophagaceae bacterium]